MRPGLIRSVLCAAMVLTVAGARTAARIDDRASDSAANAAALHEMLEGKAGRRESWKSAPVLVIVTSVMDYGQGDINGGFVATQEQMTEDERAAMAADLTRALGELTNDQIKAFSSIRSESAAAGQIVRVLRPGQIVVGRFRGVREKTGSIGYGGRMTRDGRITAGAVIVDRDADLDASKRAVLRTHELGHAIGFNHVESRPSVMNPRAGAGLTEFDRAAIKLAYFRLAVT